MITITRSQRDLKKKPWWWIGGDTRPHKELFKAHGARWSVKRKQWYLIAESLPEVIQNLADSLNGEEQAIAETGRVEDHSVDAHDPCSLEEASRVLGIPLSQKRGEEAMHSDQKIEAEAEVVEPIRILPAPEADESIKETMQELKASPPTLSIGPSDIKTGRQKIPQTYCGELTGSITGAVWCYGYVRHVSIFGNCLVI